MGPAKSLVRRLAGWSWLVLALRGCTDTWSRSDKPCFECDSYNTAVSCSCGFEVDYESRCCREHTNSACQTGIHPSLCTSDTIRFFGVGFYHRISRSPWLLIRFGFFVSGPTDQCNAPSRSHRDFQAINFVRKVLKFNRSCRIHKKLRIFTGWAFLQAGHQKKKRGPTINNFGFSSLGGNLRKNFYHIDTHKRKFFENPAKNRQETGKKTGFRSELGIFGKNFFRGSPLMMRNRNC